MALLTLLTAACEISPQPLPPPIIKPTPGAPLINVDLLSIEHSNSGPNLVGADGAVSPAGDVLRVTNLELNDAPLETAVSSTGSFSIGVDALVGNVHRVQAFLAGQPSLPVDLIGRIGILPDPELEVIVQPLAECLQVDPPLVVGPFEPSEPQTVTISNTCAADMEIGGTSLRLDPSSFEITGAILGVLPSGADTSFVITFNPTGVTSFEDIVFIELVAPEAGRIPITLLGVLP